MNEWFCNVVNNLSSIIPRKKNPLLENEYSVNEEKSQLHFKPIGIRQVEKAISKFTSSMGFGIVGTANFFTARLKIPDWETGAE